MPFPGFSLCLLLADRDVSSQLFYHELNPSETINSINAFLYILPWLGHFVIAILEVAKTQILVPGSGPLPWRNV